MSKVIAMLKLNKFHLHSPDSLQTTEGTVDVCCSVLFGARDQIRDAILPTIDNVMIVFKTLIVD